MRLGIWTSLLVLAVAVGMLSGGEARAQPIDPSLVGLVDPGTGEWHLRGPDGFATSFFFGNPGDFPFVGDWDCDGVDTPGLYRQSDGYAYLRNSNTQGVADTRFFFGNPGDLPLAGDFDGDGCDTLSLYRPSEGRVFVINKLGLGGEGLGAAEIDYYFGNPGDKPFVGDFDGDGVDTVGLHRESTGLVYFRNSHTTGIADFQFIYGDPGDRVVAGDWTGDGVDTVGLFRPAVARFYLRYSNSQGIADASFDFGIPRMVPVSGAFGIPATEVADRSWQVNTVAAPVDWGRFASLGFGADGKAVISHGSKTGWNAYQLALTQCLDHACAAADTMLTAWSVSDHTAMSTGSDGLPVWSFHDQSGGNLVVGHCNDARCTTVTYSVVDPAEPPLPWPPPNSGVLSSMAIGPDGNPSILYMNTDQNPGQWLAQCHDVACTSANRVRLEAESGFHRFDIGFGADQLPIITTYSWRPGFRLAVIHCSQADCAIGTDSTIQSWDAGFAWGFPSIAIGTDGLPIIAYNDLEVLWEDEEEIHNESLKVAHCHDAACEQKTITTIEPGRTDFVSMDIGGDGLPIIAYHAAGTLKVAHCDNTACTSATITTVDSGPGVGEYAFLAVDPFGMPVIAYYDATGHDLRVARLGT